ncbi:hypothetical protein F5883DRAFT_174415 [Diaporthe sp. PMI_573]|nr:hypothetical protein F5883DRAFT_174415 [Diaporthaceae sp. PMI_573]
MAKVIDDSKRIIQHTSIDVRYDSDSLLPPDFENGIRLNGHRDDGHEAFHFTHNSCSDWCKTDRKPYDLVVWAILLRAKQLTPNAIEIRYVSPINVARMVLITD